MDFFPLPDSKIPVWDFLDEVLPECRSILRKGDTLLTPPNDNTHEASKTTESVFPSDIETKIIRTDVLSRTIETLIKNFVTGVTEDKMNMMYTPHTYVHPIHNEQGVA